MTNLPSTESQKEIMEKIPDALSRIGVIFLLLILLILLVLSFCIHYPDTLSGKATLNSTNPAVNLVMPSTGKIILLSKPKNQVRENEIIAIVYNQANYKDVLFIKDQLSDFNNLEYEGYNDLYSRLSTDLELGEIKISYIKFLIALKTIIKQNDNYIYNHEIRSLKDKLIMGNSNLKEKGTISQINKDRFYYSEQSLIRDSLLFKKGVISKTEFEASKSLFLQQQMQLQEYILDYENVEGAIQTTKNDINRINLQKQKNDDIIYNSLIDHYIELITTIEAWEKKYLVISPIEGLLEYMQFLNTNQYINMNTNLFCIMPNDQVSEVEVVMPSQGVGKIRVGQKAIIKLTDYPSKEYGDLIGRVKDISLSKITVEGENLSFIKVQLENDGLTNYGNLIDLNFGMPATVDIITEDKRLISRIFERFKYSTKNN